MKLTPADVRNVAFSKPPIGKRGYNEDEVDQFLDLVETELARLTEENNDLQQRNAELERELADARAGGGQPSAGSTVAFASPNAPAVQEAAPANDEEANLRAARVLALAQDTADRLTNNSRSVAEKLVSDARSQSEAMVTDARQKSESMVSDARQRSDALLADAQTRSENQLRQAQERSDALQAEAEQKHTDIMTTINQQRTVLEGRIEQLKTYEREYRTRLKTYLEGQLEELQSLRSAAPVDHAQGRGGDFNDPGNSSGGNPSFK